jgi:tRNA (cmo5U34)-methyltransferase
MDTQRASFETPAQWSFELPSVASHFDSHVREQLPFYELATAAVADLVRFYLQDGGTLLDIGASTGNVSAACRSVIDERHATVINVEPSHEMASRFKGIGSVISSRIEDIEIPECDVAVSFLTLGFVAPRKRRSLVDRIMQSVCPGGALILLERVEQPGNATASRLLLSAAKLRAGSPPQAVVSKEVSIAGVLRPVDCQMLSAFRPWLFFAYGDFQGYVVEKPE